MAIMKIDITPAKNGYVVQSFNNDETLTIYVEKDTNNVVMLIKSLLTEKVKTTKMTPHIVTDEEETEQV